LNLEQSDNPESVGGALTDLRRRAVDALSP
jgi:hypothetical protein